MLSGTKLASLSFVALSVFGAFAPAARADRVAGAPMTMADVPQQPDIPVTREGVREALVAARAQNLATFRAYVAGGVYPSNTFGGGKVNVWRDADGHFCAAATIVRASGGVALADRVAEQTNLIRLADVKQGPLMDWILTSGFTQDEIAMIQEPFSRVGMMGDGDGGAGPVVQINPELRAKETARLKVRYAAIEKALVDKRVAAANLDKAVARLMKNAPLASTVVRNAQFQVMLDRGTMD